MVRRINNLVVNENGRLINLDDELQYSNFLGIHLSKASRERAAARKAERHASNLAKIEARNAPKLALAQQGIATPSGFSQALSSLGNLALSLTGHAPTTDSMINDQVNQSLGSQSQLVQLQSEIEALKNGSITGNQIDNTQQNIFSSKNLPYIIGGVLLFVILIVVLLKKK